VCGGGRHVRGRLVGEDKLVREGRASASRCRGKCRQGGLGFLSSRRILSCAIAPCAIKACAIKACAIKTCAIKGVCDQACAIKASPGCCHQGGCEFLKQVKGASTSLRVQILSMAIAAGRAVTGARGSSSVGPRQQRRAKCCVHMNVLVLEVCAASFWGFVGVGGCALYDGGSESCAMCAGSHALHAALCVALYTGGCGGLALSAGGVGGTGGDALCATLCWRVRSLYGVVGCVGSAGGAGDDTLCATLYAGGCGGRLCLLEAPEVMRGVLLCLLEVLRCWKCRRKCALCYSACRR